MTHQAGSGQPDILQMQPDGNLVLYAPFSYVAPKATANVKSAANLKEDTSIWSPNREARFTLENTGQAILQPDGNAVIYETGVEHAAPLGRSEQDLVMWSTDTHATVNAEANLRLNDSGSLCLKKNGTCLWDLAAQL
ncbi:hypothetical protein BV898_04193 [Hypsibius exemplaris]|uniref:Bulb-type lectin domain-containing protein n=1 Tax=Hypsibius exemplaris TaxID=2072580 RepID=A0A1W0X3W1_HYPEX|nr:hypothetical protein BV898_04193 [Hypsibius exemplaris]